MPPHKTRCCSELPMCCRVLQCVAVCCSVLQCVAVCCSVLLCVAVCCASSIESLQRDTAKQGLSLKLRAHVFTYGVSPSEWRRPIGYLICIGYFLQKNPINGGAFAKRGLQLEGSYASSPPSKVNSSKCDECTIVY